MVYPSLNKFLSFLSVFLITLFSALPFLHADEKNSPPKVVVTIKPLHSLVSGVMKGVGEPTLLLKGASSPHHFQLKPSDALAIKKADLIVRVGPLLETPLNKVLKSLSKKGSVLNAVDLDGITFYKMRSKHHHHDEEAHSDHDGHDDHKKKHAKHDDHDDHDDHHKKKNAKHDDHDDHDHHKEKHAKHDDHDDHDDHKKKHAKHDNHDDHDHHKEKHAKHDDHDDHDDHKGDDSSEKDPHMWLHPGNAKTIALAVAKKLSELDPKNSKTYQQNASALSGQLDKLSSDIAALMKPLDERSYMVFHDAYQYITAPYDLHFSGAITLNPATPPSAKHLKELISRLKEKKVICIFSEVQYNPKLVKTLSEGHKVKTAVLDPIGAKLEAGPAAYFTMMKNLSTEINKCMKP